MLYERRVKVKLHGYLKDLYPHDLELTGFSVSEIINGMCKVTKAFNPVNGQPHVLKVVGFDTKESLFTPIPANQNEIHVIPAMIGGKSGFFKVIIGAVLIAASFAFPATMALSLGSGLGTIGSMFFNFGFSLLLGGLLEMVSPQPKADKFGNSAADPEASKYLAATANTTRIGTRIPLAYGTNMVYGHYLSFDVDAKDVAV